MPSFSRVFAIGVLASSALAQTQYSIEPNSVALSTRQQWCLQQEQECPLICLQTVHNSATTQQNECNPQTLTYSCVCSNGLSPNVTEYSQTLPYFICTEWGTQCVSNCGSNNACAAACRQDHPCGALDPKRVKPGASTASAGPSPTVGAGIIASTTTTTGAGTVCTGLGADACTQATGTSSASGSASTSLSLSKSAASSIRPMSRTKHSWLKWLAVPGAWLLVFGFLGWINPPPPDR